MLSGACEPGSQRRQVADVADAPTRRGGAREQWDEQTRPATTSMGAHARQLCNRSARESRRSMPSENSASGTIRLTTRYDSRGKSKKYPGCASTPSFIEQVEHEIFFRPECRHLQDGVPAALASKHAARGRRSISFDEAAVVGGDASLDLRAYRPSPLEELGCRRPARASKPTDMCRTRARAVRAHRRRRRRDRPPRSIQASPAEGRPTSRGRRG